MKSLRALISEGNETGGDASEPSGPIFCSSELRPRSVSASANRSDSEGEAWMRRFGPEAAPSVLRSARSVGRHHARAHRRPRASGASADGPRRTRCCRSGRTVRCEHAPRESRSRSCDKARDLQLVHHVWLARTSSPSQLANRTDRRGCQPRLTNAPKPLTISLSAAAPETGSEAPSVQAVLSAGPLSSCTNHHGGCRRRCEVSSRC